jgi:hypothetical protein
MGDVSMQRNQPAIRSVQKASYAVPWAGDPRLHEEVMWYATSDDQVLGVVIRDRIDNDFGWVLLAKESNVFRCIDVQTSRPTAQLATDELHGAMCKRVSIT